MFTKSFQGITVKLIWKIEILENDVWNLFVRIKISQLTAANVYGIAIKVVSVTISVHYWLLLQRLVFYQTKCGHGFMNLPVIFLIFF